MVKSKLKSIALATVAILLGATFVFSPSPAYAEDCPEGGPYLATDVMSIHPYGEASGVPNGQYPDYSLYWDTLISLSPCQWWNDNYEKIRIYLQENKRQAQMAILAAERTRSEKAKIHYQILAKSIVFEDLAAAMAGWAANTNELGSNQILQEFWNQDLDLYEIEKIYHQLSWHYTFIGEKTKKVDQIYSFIKYTTGIVNFPTKALSGYDNYQKVMGFLKKDSQKRLAKKDAIQKNYAPTIVTLYMMVLSESKDIVLPVYYKTNSSILSNSWSSLVGLGGGAQ